MKLLLIASCLFSLPVLAGDLKQFETSDLVCVFHSPSSLSWEGATTSCVSKASIQKDKLQLQVLELQKKQLEQELSTQTASKTKK